MERMNTQQRELDKVNASITKTIEETIKKAEERGKIQERLDIAMALLDVLEDEVIAEKLGLSIERVQELRNRC